METSGPRKATSYRPSPEDRAVIALLQRELGVTSLNSLLNMGLRELLKKNNLKLPEPTAPAKKRTRKPR